MKLLTLILSVSLLTCLQAQEETPPVLEPGKPSVLEEIMEAKSFEAESGTTLPYRIFVPEGGGVGKPLFLAMHGAGGRGSDNRKTIYHSPWALHGIMSEYARETYPCVVVAPQCPNGKRWVDRNWNQCVYSIDEVAITKELQAAVELLDAVLKETKADPKRVYVGGFSMGGYGTWDLVTRFPERFAAAVPVCGGLDPSRAEAIRDLPIWTFHGDKDGVVPPTGTRALAEALKESDIFKYTELTDTGHNAWEPAWTRSDTVDWVFSQKR